MAPSAVSTGRYANVLGGVHARSCVPQAGAGGIGCGTHPVAGLTSCDGFSGPRASAAYLEVGEQFGGGPRNGVDRAVEHRLVVRRGLAEP